MFALQTGVSAFRSLRVAVLALALLPAVAHGQSLYGVDGTTNNVPQFTGPPAPPCFYPNGPVIGGFPFLTGGPCFPPGLFTPPPGNLVGDVAVDRVNDRIFMTDGTVIGVYSSTGVMQNVMLVTPVGIQVTGLSYDPVANLLWYSSGTDIFSATPSAAGSCAPVAVASFFAPGALGFVTDVSWSPGTGLLYCCNNAGLIAAYTPAGVLAIGPYFAWGLTGCGMSPVLTGIAVDTSTTCSSPVPNLYVTDGFSISYEKSGGTPAPTKFYTPFNCFPNPGPATSGLEYAARPITYGNGTGPVISAKGQSVLPNPAFALRVTNGPPLGKAWLVAGTGAACPSLNFFGNPWYVLPFSTILGPFTLTATGQFQLPAALPAPMASFPCGISIYVQWVCKSTSNVWTTSAGLEFTTSLP